MATGKRISDHRIALRELEQKRFLAFSGTAITWPGSRVRECRTVIINRERIESLAPVDHD